jgi:lysozyme family protein
MSDFHLAIPTILTHEGGYIDHPQDPGGATNFGISWHFLQRLPTYQHIKDIRELTFATAVTIYQTEWWERYHYANISNQILATKLLDLAVNMGGPQAHICLQRAIRAATGNRLSEDGILGMQSFTAVNAADPSSLLAAFKSEVAGFYRLLHQPPFEKGWLARAYD